MAIACLCNARSSGRALVQYAGNPSGSAILCGRNSRNPIASGRTWRRGGLILFQIVGCSVVYAYLISNGENTKRLRLFSSNLAVTIRARAFLASYPDLSIARVGLA